MGNGFRKINAIEIKGNPFEKIGEGWMLITAGNLDEFNTMTASWGTLGVLWNLNVAICFVRPQRYTYQFMEKFNRFTLSFFKEKYREVLKFCGSHSGRNVDKIAQTNIHPLLFSDNAVGFQEAELTIVCNKIYSHQMSSEMFENLNPDTVYPLKDYHRMYIGEIDGCYERI